MLGETYEIKPDKTGRNYTFVSVGPKGAIEKIVLFQYYGPNYFNLAFGDVQKNFVNDGVVSNNQDFVKVLSTVAKCAYHFIEKYPGARLKIVPVDDGRRMLYNIVFKRHYKVITKKFEIFGRVNEALEAYNPEKLYDEFELRHRV